MLGLANNHAMDLLRYFQQIPSPSIGKGMHGGQWAPAWDWPNGLAVACCICACACKLCGVAVQSIYTFCSTWIISCCCACSIDGYGNFHNHKASLCLHKARTTTRVTEVWMLLALAPAEAHTALLINMSQSVKMSLVSPACGLYIGRSL